MEVKKPAMSCPNVTKPASARPAIGVNFRSNAPHQLGSNPRRRRKYHGRKHNRCLDDGSASTPKMTNKFFPVSLEATSNRFKVVRGSKAYNIHARESFTHREPESRIIDNLPLTLSCMQACKSTAERALPLRSKAELVSYEREPESGVVDKYRSHA